MDEKVEFKYSLMLYVILVIFSPIAFYVTINHVYLSYNRHNYSDMVYFGIFFLIALAYTSEALYLSIWGKAIVLTNESIFIGASGYTIDWTDIKHIGRSVVRANRSEEEYIEIYVSDPKKYIDLIRNPLIRFFKWRTRNLSNSPFYINLEKVRGNNEEIFGTVLRFYQNNRGF